MDINWSKKRKQFHTKNQRSTQYPTETMIDTEEKGNLSLFTNTPTQAKFLLHNLKPAAGGIGLYMNANKIEFMCFKQEVAISTLNSKPLNLVDQFKYLSSNISSIKNDVNKCLMKAWTAIDRLLTI